MIPKRRKVFPIQDAWDMNLYQEDDYFRYKEPKQWEAPICMRCEGRGHRVWMRSWKLEPGSKRPIPPFPPAPPEGASHSHSSERFHPATGVLGKIESYRIECDWCAGEGWEFPIPLTEVF